METVPKELVPETPVSVTFAFAVVLADPTDPVDETPDILKLLSPTRVTVPSPPVVDKPETVTAAL